MSLYGPDGRVVANGHVPAVREARRSSLTRVVQTRGLQSIFSHMPDADEIIVQEGPDIYDRMRTDDAVFAAEFQLMTRILGRPWDVRPPEHVSGETFADEVAEYCKSVLAAMGSETMVAHLYRGLRHRHAGGQLVYRVENNYLVPNEFIPERRTIFRFGYGGKKLINLTGMWEEAEPFKWQTHVNEPEPERPGGRSMLSRVYWPWKFKRVGWELWVTAMDRFAVPSLAALFELAEADSTKAKEIADDIAESLEVVASGSVGAFPNVKDLKQIGGAKVVEGFDTFTEMCDRSIYRGILTVTLTVAEGKSGAERGNTEVHDESADQVAQWYANQIAESITLQTVAYAALLKYGEAARAVLPKFEFDFEDIVSLEKVLELMDRNFPLSRSAVYSHYASELEPQDETDAFQNPRWVDAPGDGSTNSADRFTLSFPSQDEEEVRSRLFKYFRDQELTDRFEQLTSEGATWDEALDALEEEPVWGLSRGSIRNIVARRKKSA